MSNKINILCTPDNNYVPYCGIMLTSLLENNKDSKFDVYVMCESLSTKHKENLEHLSRLYNAKIEIIQIEKTIFKECPIRVGDHVSIAAYYRLIAADVLPKGLDKILYLDCDTIINGSIKQLYNSDISGYACAACIDEGFYNEEHYKRLCYSQEYPYINSGVILFNLEYWRVNNIVNKCLKYIANNTDRVKFHDQDTLNAVLHKQIRLLHIKNNLQTMFLLSEYTKNYNANFVKEIINTALEPTIIHFTGASKPWFKGSRHPFCNRFLHYRKISLWKTTPLITHKTGIYDYLIRLRNEIIWILGLKKRPISYIIEKQD